MLEGVPWPWVRRHTVGAVRQGIALDRLLDDSMIVLRHGDDRDTISPAQWMLLCMNTSLGIADSAHGLAASTIMPEFSGIGLRMALGSATLESAINALAKLYRMASGAVRIDLAVAGDMATLSVHADARCAEDAIQLEETYLIWVLMHCLYYLDGPMPVIDVATRDRAHFNLGRQHFAFRAPLRCGDRTAFRFARRLLAARTPTRAGENPFWESGRLWLTFVASEGADPGTARRVGVNATLGAFAADAGISASTARRRLLASDGGFRSARQRVIVDAATERLRQTSQSVDAIAVDLGYADARSFRRFIKTATGRTPQHIRATAHDGDRDRPVEAKLRHLGTMMSI